jgi:hypothetical protein
MANNDKSTETETKTENPMRRFEDDRAEAMYLVGMAISKGLLRIAEAIEVREDDDDEEDDDDFFGQGG